jgi:glycosyltransferase involved in cell wall biosynthesis
MILLSAYVPMLRAAFGHADLVLFQTETQREAFAEQWGVHLARTALLPNGHEVGGEFRYQTAESRCVLWLAGIKDVKRPELYVELSRSLARDRIGCRLAGKPFDSRHRAWLARVVEEERNLDYVGELSRDEVPKALQGCLALISTSATEGFPNTFIEAWMQGRPVASLGIDPDGVISKHGLGIVADNLSSIAEWLVRLADSPSMQLEYGQRCRQYAVENHDIAETARVLDHELSAVLDD